ncbi:protein kinase [Zalerion maritima]|uniref:Protein kinase n=1 Tax=Zalerion maritima TaxID=339359 RepID=A0AAD5WM22_9PEZI|nr:protein kinase [Zalerion maritima]
MAFSNSGGTLTIPSPTHVHHAEPQIKSLRRSLSRSPSKFNLARTHSAASTTSQQSFCSLSSDSSFSGQTPQSPCPQGAPSSAIPAPSRSTPTPGALPSLRSSTAKQVSSTPGSFFPSTTPGKATSIFATPQASQQNKSQYQPASTFSGNFQHPAVSSSSSQQRQDQLLASQQKTRTPFAPAPPRTGIRLSLRSARFKGSNSSARASSRNRTPPRSPLKRALSISSDSGNSTTTPTNTPPQHLASGQENKPVTLFPPLSPIPARTVDRGNRHSMHLDISGASNQTIFKLFESTTPEGLPASSTASPLKRSDATMDFDQPSLDSPVAKRRSVHGFGGLGVPENFNIFDQDLSPANQTFEVHRDEDSFDKEYLLTGAPNSRLDTPASPTPHHQFPRRSGSLRRTAHQRISGRDSWGRRQAAQNMANANNNDVATPLNKNSRPRLTMDIMTNQAREGPFTGFPGAPGFDKPSYPHPLSRAITNSSSNSSAPDESPTPQFAAPARPNRANEPVNFAKSLPLGSRPPMFPEAVQTPRFDLSKRPMAGPASTGLVSKMQTLPYEESIDAANKVAMPDTPCKKPYNNFATFPPNGSSGKTRHPRPTFDIAATPFNPAVKQSGTFGNPRRVPSLFSQFRASNGHNRSGSTISVEAEDRKLGDEVGADDFPPTPTKISSAHRQQFSTPRGSDSPTSRFAVPTSAVGNSLSRRSSFSGNCKSKNVHYGRSFVSSGGSPQQRSARVYVAASRSLTQAVLPASQYESEAPDTPCPALWRVAFETPAAPNTRTKTVAASPLDRFEFHHSATPHTPRGVAPPDPSSLSISNNGDGGHMSMPPPATPTTRHDSSVASRRVITPINSTAAVDLDEVLVQSFDNVSEIGSGEFSKVYRVVSHRRQSAPTYSLTATPVEQLPSSPGPQVFAVKKITMPLGNRDRQEKLREASILGSLSHDNVVRFVRAWEQLGHLYIQTEFCEIGNLSSYLLEVGKNGRLDDFRIWKMILEIGAGLEHIHDSGFIHLDMKPANVLIDNEGVLKIGDFGLASAWPANNSIEGEGDREYIAPEVLEGRYDKPADVFALGLIVLEIAGNVRLPGNGPTWRGLRTGSLKTVPTLTYDPINGSPIVTTSPDIGLEKSTPHRNSGRRRLFNTKKSAQKARKLDPREDAPEFMTNMDHTSSLDRVVHWMISPRPEDRPTIQQVLLVEGSLYVSAHRQAGAAIFEGKYGPRQPSYQPNYRLPTLTDSPASSTMSDGDTVMTDV